VKAKLELENLPFQLHRLDKLTTGALLLATNDRHVKTFAKQFQDHDIRKSYLAIVRGGRESFRGARTGTIDEWLGVEDGRVRVDEMNGSLALTGWELLGSSEKVPLSLLKLSLLTGHKHQLRVHLAEILHCPVLGDTLYSKSSPTPDVRALLPPNISIGNARVLKDNEPKEVQSSTPSEKRIFLHSAHISMTRYQPRGSKNKKITLGISAPVPSDFLAICTAAGLRHAIPEAFVKGSVEIDGVPVRLDEEVGGFGGRWFGEPEEVPVQSS